MNPDDELQQHLLPLDDRARLDPGLGFAQLKQRIARLSTDQAEAMRVDRYLDEIEATEAAYRAGCAARSDGDLDTAEQELRRAALRGHPEAAHELAVLLVERGGGSLSVECDDELLREAAAWLPEAVDAGAVAPEDLENDLQRLWLIAPRLVAYGDDEIEKLASPASPTQRAAISVKHRRSIITPGAPARRVVAVELNPAVAPTAGVNLIDGDCATLGTALLWAEFLGSPYLPIDGHSGPVLRLLRALKRRLWRRSGLTDTYRQHGSFPVGSFRVESYSVGCTFKAMADIDVVPLLSEFVVRPGPALHLPTTLHFSRSTSAPGLDAPLVVVQEAGWRVVRYESENSLRRSRELLPPAALLNRPTISPAVACRWCSFELDYLSPWASPEAPRRYESTLCLNVLLAGEPRTWTPDYLVGSEGCGDHLAAMVKLGALLLGQCGANDIAEDENLWRRADDRADHSTMVMVNLDAMIDLLLVRRGGDDIAKVTARRWRRIADHSHSCPRAALAPAPVDDR